MFCYQRSFGSPTETVTAERFWALVRAPQTSELIDGYRTTGEASLKRKLPAFIFQATFDETISKTGKSGRWRKQAATRLTGLVVMDVDHVESEELRVKSEEFAAADFPKKAKELGILLIYITPSGKGLKIVFKARTEGGNLIDNQHAMAKVLGVEVDESCKDASRLSFICKEEDIQYIDNELFTYENMEFAEKYNEEYRNGHSAGVKTNTDGTDKTDKKTNTNITNQTNNNPSDPNNSWLEKEYLGVPFQTIIEAWSKQRFSGSNVSRHEASVVLARDLYIMTDRDKQATLALLMAQKWVQEIIQERQEDVERTVNNAADYVAAQENENAKKGKSWLPKISKEMKETIDALSNQTTPGPSSLLEEGSGCADNDVYAVLPLEEWAKELQEMAQYYPCLKELFLNVHPHKLAAVWFSSAALFGTLMTRAWYHFWYEPEIVRRLNYCIFIIGDPGAGKNIVEKFYKKIADPMIQADQCFIDAVNRYKEGRTERTTSTKAQKGDALKRPVVGIRVHPARTATGEFIRHMNAAIETVQGVPLNLHMFSFDAELDNVNKQNKGGDWKDREIMELKAFHNEQEGQMYANQESYTGMFNIYWNFIYTGTPYALHRKVNQRNFGTGMSTRLAVIPLPDKGMAKRCQEVDPNANETIRTWAYRLDKVEGELPIEALNEETYDWQSSRMEIADFNGDKADRMLLKRIPYYGIGVSLPFILMRHWDEWQEHRTLTMDDRDRRLCRLAMEIQYKCQQFFFGEMAFNYYADQDKEFVVRKRTTRYSECFRKLPDEFKTQQFMEIFGCSQQAASRAIIRFQKDGVVGTVKYGLYKKVVSELP
jgi:hypothetical protein